MPNAHDSWAWVYDEVYEKSFGSFYANLTSQTLSVVDGLLAPGSSILDVGAGTGRLAIPLSDRGYSIVAIDASKPMLDVLRSKDPASRIHTVHTKLQELALKDQFDFGVDRVAVGGLTVLGRLGHAVAILITRDWRDPREKTRAHGQQITRRQQIVNLLPRGSGCDFSILRR